MYSLKVKVSLELGFILRVRNLKEYLKYTMTPYAIWTSPRQ